MLPLNCSMRAQGLGDRLVYKILNSLYSTCLCPYWHEWQNAALFRMHKIRAGLLWGGGWVSAEEEKATRGWKDGKLKLEQEVSDRDVGYDSVIKASSFFMSCDGKQALMFQMLLARSLLLAATVCAS